jgi:micrococcal nuclease
VRNRSLLIAAAATLVAVALLLWPRSHAPAGHGTAATIVRDVDGDTVLARAGRRTFYVRLLGIDTPETHRPGTPVECGGPEASARMSALVPPGTHVRLETDPTQDRVDRYGRLLAYVWLPDGRLAEDVELESGWATTYVYEGNPVELFSRLAAAAKRARVAHRGVWARCGGDFHSASG